MGKKVTPVSRKDAYPAMPVYFLKTLPFTILQMTEDTDCGIIKRIRDGDRDAFAGLVDKYKTRIFNLAFRLSGSHTDADELTQIVFVRTFETLDRFDAGQPFFPWLYTIALNTIRNACKRKYRRIFFLNNPANINSSSTQSLPSPEDRLMLHEKVDQLAAVLKKLPYQQREAIILRYFEQCTYAEIAGYQHISLSAAKMRVIRGMAKLQKLMVETGDENI